MKGILEDINIVEIMEDESVAKEVRMTENFIVKGDGGERQ